MFKLFSRFSVLAATSILVLACGDSNNDTSRLRVIHNSADAPAVDLLLNDSRVLNSLSYPSDSGYLEVDSGTSNVKVLVSGTETVAIEANLSLEKNISFSVIALNEVAKIEPLVLIDQVHTPNDQGCAIRVVHGAPTAPEVDVYATAVGASIDNAEPVLSSVKFKAASPYLNLPCGEYQFRVTIADTKTVAIDSGKVNLSRGAYTAIARENKGGGAPYGLGLFSDGL